ncbi:MAG: hypothetical protein ACN6OB_16765 [Chryseobacterium jejuense]|uniref:hypothetical protein n=1 Tax=Chryseobacterium jejuense TaxID=445960 RepID=UPI003D0A0A03
MKKFESEEEVAKITFDFFECFDEFIEVGKLSNAYNTNKAQNTVKNFLQDFQNDRDYLIR